MNAIRSHQGLTLCGADAPPVPDNPRVADVGVNRDQAVRPGPVGRTAWWALSGRSTCGQGQRGPAWRPISRLISLSEIGLFRKTIKASAARNSTHAMAG